MDVRLLAVESCPHHDAAEALLRRSLDDVGLARVAVLTQIVSTPEEATELGFPGSPTFLFDGQDLFPEPEREPALTCRLYPTTSGLVGLPDTTSLRRALKQAAGRATSTAGARHRLNPPSHA
jgi:hypothetical protein